MKKKYLVAVLFGLTHGLLASAQQGPVSPPTTTTASPSTTATEPVPESMGYVGATTRIGLGTTRPLTCVASCIAC